MDLSPRLARALQRERFLSLDAPHVAVAVARQLGMKQTTLRLGTAHRLLAALPTIGFLLDRGATTGAAEAIVAEVVDEASVDELQDLYRDLRLRDFDPAGKVRLIEAVRSMMRKRAETMVARWLQEGTFAIPELPRKHRGVWRSQRQIATPITWEVTRD